MHNAPSRDLLSPENWDDVRYVLAVAETGTVSAAARQLGVNHATVLRRIAAFEQRQGAPIFEKTRSGYRVPPDRLRVIEAMREVQASVNAVARMMKGATAPLSGAVRLTSTDSLCQLVLPAILGQIRADAPNLRFDLYGTNAHMELGRLQADIAVRPTQKLPDDLFGIQAGQIGFAAYRAVGDVGQTRWLGIGGPSARSVAAAWIERTIDPDQIAGAADSFLILREMAAEGQGCAVLPCYVGDHDARLHRMVDALPAMSVGLWVASHLDLADTPRIRIVRDLLAAALVRKSAWLLGQAAPGI